MLRQYKFLRLGCEDAADSLRRRANPRACRVTWGDFTHTDSRDKQITHYERGMMEGWSVVYRDDGSLLSSAYFHENQLHGVVRHFDGQGIGGRRPTRSFLSRTSRSASRRYRDSRRSRTSCCRSRLDQESLAEE